jgi:hypothetical protein
MCQAFIYCNTSATAIELIIEPWAELYLIESGAQVEVTGVGGGAESCFEIHHTERGLIVFGWINSIVTVTRDGKAVEPSPQQ